MSRKLMSVGLLSAATFLSASSVASGITCNGEMINPITDICWDCFFPIRIGSTTIFSSGIPDETTEGSLVGVCPMELPPFFRIGLNISYWEPHTLADIVKEPYCMYNMGFSVKSVNANELEGTDSYQGLDNPPQVGTGATYEVHWYEFPLFYLLDLAADIACVQTSSTSLDVAYMTEIDPTWLDEDSAAVMFPEELLFNNEFTVAACAADAALTTTGSHTASDSLFWCIGNQGLAYPMVGKTTTVQSKISNAVEILEKFNFKLHRQGFVNETHSGNPANCEEIPDVYLPKKRYRYQMTLPTPSPDWCYPYGTTTQLWEAGRDLPKVSHGNYAFLNWRKRSCLLL